MKFNTHDRTPRAKNSKVITSLFLLCAVLIYGSFGLASFACFYYAQSVIGGILTILIPILLTVIILIQNKDIKKAYVEIREHEIYVVDYYLGIKKEKQFLFSDITSAEICSGYSHRVKGYRLRVAGMRYIVFRNGKKYLFKIIYLPETERVFKQFIQ